MEIRTFTSFWNMERKVYAIYDISLPVPISLKVLGAFAAVGVPWWALLNFVGLPFGSFYFVYLLPPVALGFLATKPIYQDKTLFQFALSFVRYISQPKYLNGLRDQEFPIGQAYQIKTRIFVRDEQLLTLNKESNTL